jgi:hypothetical protein
VNDGASARARSLAAWARRCTKTATKTTSAATAREMQTIEPDSAIADWMSASPAMSAIAIVTTLAT